MKKAVVLLSGGLDSSTTAAIARNEGYDIYALSFDYGQRHAIELQSAARIAAAIGAIRHLVTHFDMRNIGGSALTDDIAVPKDGAEAQNIGSAELLDQIPVTYVPARNTIFLSFALAWAEVLGATSIFIGANAVDYSGYPDCRPEYLEAFETMANLATKSSIEGGLKFKIHAPLLKMTKSEIIGTGLKLGLDYSLTWSCYDPQEIGKDRSYAACGRCDSCLFRKKGFQEAGMSDPVIYI